MRVDCSVGLAGWRSYWHVPASSLADVCLSEAAPKAQWCPRDREHGCSYPSGLHGCRGVRNAGRRARTAVLPCFLHILRPSYDCDRHRTGEAHRQGAILTPGIEPRPLARARPNHNPRQGAVVMSDKEPWLTIEFSVGLPAMRHWPACEQRTLASAARSILW